MGPLGDNFQQWKTGKVGHEAVGKAIGRAYGEKCLVNTVLDYLPDGAVAVIQWRDREWFLDWIKENRPPADAELEAPPAETVD